MMKRASCRNVGALIVRGGRRKEMRGGCSEVCCDMDDNAEPGQVERNSFRVPLEPFPQIPCQV